MYYLSFSVCLGQFLTPVSLYLLVWKTHKMNLLHKSSMNSMRQHKQNTLLDNYFYSIVISHNNNAVTLIHWLLLYASHTLNALHELSHFFPPTSLK